MRVLFLAKYNVSIGGVAEVLRNLSAALRCLGVEICIYSNDPSADAPPPDNPNMYVYGALPRPKLFGKRPALRHLIRVCKDRQIDLIHCHGLYRPGFAARLIKQAIGLPYLVTSHGDLVSASDRMQRRSVRRRCRAVLRDADAITHLTNAMAHDANALCDVTAKSRVIPNGVDRTWWSSPARPIPEYDVLAIGRLVDQKGFDVLLDALKRLADRGRGMSMVIAGEGPAEASLREQAKHLGLRICHRLDELSDSRSGAVHYAGHVTGQSKRNLFGGCRMVAFASQREEGFGLVILEAMAAGKVVLASDMQNARAILGPNAQCQLVGTPGDASLWADAIEEFDRNATRRRRCEAMNLARSARFNWSTVAAQYLEVYREVISATTPTFHTSSLEPGGKPGRRRI